MADPGTDPSQRRLQRDLAAGEFEGGVSAGMWRLVLVDWPYIIVAITTGDGRELGMRLAVDGYPAQAPAGQPWHLQLGAPLPVPLWPTGGTASQIFRTDWSISNANAPYLACDRVGLSTHPEWANVHPQRAWHPGRTIAFYLSEIHHELQCATIPHVAEGA